MASLDRPREADTVNYGREARTARLEALHIALKAHGIVSEIQDGGALDIPSANHGRVGVWCRPRAVDGGRLWFFREGGHALAEADDITNTVVEIKHLLARVRM